MNLKSSREIAIIKKAGDIVFGALEIAKKNIRPGISTFELDAIIEKYIVDAGAVASCKNYNGYPAASCLSINNGVVHGIPGKRVLKTGDIISVDIVAQIDGYHADAARTFPVGEISKEAQELIRVTELCFWNALEFAKVGNRIGDVSSCVQKTAEDAGFSVVRELIGHGIGQAMHEKPDVPNYGEPNRGERISSGMVFTIEPMINMGKKEIELLDDQWTVVTQDGKYSAHYENTIVVLDSGAEVLTTN